MPTIQTAVILDAGKGARAWPYAQIRSKGMIPVSARPLLRHTVEALRKIGVEKIVVVGGAFAQQVKNEFRLDGDVRVIEDKAPRGAAFSLLAAKDALHLAKDEGFLALYSDTLITEPDLRALKEAFEAEGNQTALLSALRPVPEVAAFLPPRRQCDSIVCGMEDGRVRDIRGHPRDEGSHSFAGFAFSGEIFSALEANSGRFLQTQVGMMPPLEGYIEGTLADLVEQGECVRAVEAVRHVVDIDKPWQILEASYYLNKLRCAALSENILAEGASIHPSAAVNGKARLGAGSSIGLNVIINGNVIVGRNSVIENGAILKGDCVIGDDTKVRDGCLLSDATVGSRCIVGHGAELSGILFDNAYLYHYMEVYGIVGENTDLGAATVFGTLRFDDGVTRHRTRGHWEAPHPFSDAAFLGDYCRTGVNAILMPGVRVGPYSIVGAGVRLMNDLEDHTLLYAEQTQVKKAWNESVYGW